MDDAQKQMQSTPQAPTFVQVDDACRQFEAEWRSGNDAKIEDYIASWEEPERSKLLYELLSIEVDFRRRRGEEPSAAEQESRFAETCHVVKEVFQRGKAAEDTKTPAELSETLVMNTQLADVRYHAEGGLGVVCSAEDGSLKRNMAVKFIHRRVADDPASRARFLLEAEVTSRLEHPGVVPVHGVGETETGQPFYAMRFIHGETLDVAIDRFYETQDARAADKELQFRELLQRFVAVCKTIAYAHNRGIVHRDIKPMNIMLGRYGQTLVVDWGLALPVTRQGVFKESGERTLLPTTGSDSARLAAGTPAFMSPEQASGNLDLSPASDIYSLGATLYKILTGKLPFGGKDSLGTVARGEFKRPRHVNKHTSPVLEAICLKAMSLLPQNRYPTALEFAKDIENYLADVPVTAYQEPLSRKLARWTRRHRILAQAIGAGLLALTVCGFLASGWLARQAHRESDLRAAAESAQRGERDLRKQGLQVSAEFAARMLANQIDIRWRILEKEAADSRLRENMQLVNADPLNEDAWKPIQEWLDARNAAFPDLGCRSWFVQARSGVQVARSPSHRETGERYPSLGANYSYRDYFHGGGRDYYLERQFERSPLSQVHNSTAIESTNDGFLTVVFSAPIFEVGGQEVAGVIGVSVELGSFTDLRIRLTDGEKLLLVETRKYYMQRRFPEEHEERGEALVLHHEDFEDLTSLATLPHVSDNVVSFMQTAIEEWKTASADDTPANLLPDDYADPLATDENGRWLAAFAPVLVSARPKEIGETGWFVIVQQRQ